jgi:hypothetical protein
MPFSASGSEDTRRPHQLETRAARMRAYRCSGAFLRVAQPEVCATTSRDFGPRSDLDEARGRRVEDRRAALICGNEMAAGADLEREPAAGGDSPRLLPARGPHFFTVARTSFRRCSAGFDPRKSERKGLRGQQRFSHRVRTAAGLTQRAAANGYPILAGARHAPPSFSRSRSSAAQRASPLAG